MFAAPTTTAVDASSHCFQRLERLKRLNNESARAKSVLNSMTIGAFKTEQNCMLQSFLGYLEAMLVLFGCLSKPFRAASWILETNLLALGHCFSYLALSLALALALAFSSSRHRDRDHSRKLAARAASQVSAADWVLKLTSPAPPTNESGEKAKRIHQCISSHLFPSAGIILHRQNAHFRC